MQAQKKKLSKRKRRHEISRSAERDRRRRRLAPPFEKGGRKLQLKVHETLSVCDTKKGNHRGFPFLYLLIAAVDMCLEAIYYHIESDGIFSALLHNDISHSLARLHI